MNAKRSIISIPILLSLLIFVFLLHLAVGAKFVPLKQVFESFFSYNADIFAHVIIRDLRLPRALIALMVGAALACAGALMQGSTRNPLAEPSILGLLTGASFSVVMYVAFSESQSDAMIPFWAAFGALTTAFVVWGISTLSLGIAQSSRSASGNVPSAGKNLTLVLAGAAVTAFLGALITFIHITDERTLEHLRGWLVGSISSSDIQALYYSLPWFGIGLIIACGISRQVTALALGDDIATGLGINIVKAKNIVLLAVIMLTAAAVSVAGPMGFVGLVIPHIVRLFVGADYRYIIPFSCLFGAIYLLLVDIVARIALAPLEISTGLVTSLLGAPFFIWLVRHCKL